MKDPKKEDPTNLQDANLDQYGRWIPGEIYYNPIMTRLDSLLFGLIHSLCNNPKGICIASNKYLARDLKVRPNTLQKSLKKLEDEGYITREEIRDDTGMVIVRRIMIDPNYKALYRGMLIKEIEQRWLKTR